MTSTDAIVHYILSDGTRGTYQAPTCNRTLAIEMLQRQLVADGEINFSVLRVTDGWDYRR